MPSQTSKAAATLQSLWLAAGTYGTGAASGSLTGRACTSTTAGAAFPVTAQGAGLTQYLAQLAASGSVVGQLFLYDRIMDCSAASGTSTSAQTCTNFGYTGGTDYFTRNGHSVAGPLGNGVGNQIFIEFYSQTGATASNVTVSYYNQAGASKTTTAVSLSGSATTVAGQVTGPLPLAAGDTGVQGIVSVTLSASTGTAGNFGVTVAYPLAQIALPIANVGQLNPADYASLGLPPTPGVASGSTICPWFVVGCSTTSTGIIIPSATFIAG